MRLTADVPEDERIRVERVGPEILRNPRHVDGAYFIEEGGRRHIEHIEAQALYRGDEPERLAWYGVDLYHEFRLPVRSTLVLLFENRSPAKIRPGWRGDGGDVRVSSKFRVTRLWEQDAAEVLRQDHPEPLEWTPVLLHDDRACLEAYRRLHSRDDRDSLLNFMLLGGFRYGIDRWREVLKGYGEQVMYDNVLDMLEGDDFGREIIARIERRGEERGREEGLERGVEKGREEELRTLIRSSCADYFPGLDTAAIDSVTDLHRLRVIAAAVLRARSEDEARAALAIG